MHDESPLPDDAIGTIVGQQAGCVVVQLVSGEKILCRGLRRLHYPLGYYGVPVGKRAKIRYTSAKRRPLVIEVLANCE